MGLRLSHFPSFEDTRGAKKKQHLGLALVTLCSFVLRNDEGRVLDHTRQGNNKSVNKTR